MLPISQIIPATTSQNQELQKQESRQLRTGDEQRLINALESLKIKESSIEEIKQPLRYVMVKVGLRSQNWPTDEEKQILIEHIVQHFGNNTIDEIKLAFDLAITGKLDLDKKDIGCYENFSCLYFSQIMVAYREWAAQAHAQIRRQDEYKRMIEQSKPKELTDAEYEEWYELVKKQLTDQIITLQLIPDTIYDWMDRCQKINLTTSEKNEYFQKAIQFHAQILKNKVLESENVHMKYNFYNRLYNNYMQQVGEGEFSQNSRQELIRLSKKLVLFDLMINTNGQISTISKDVGRNMDEGGA